MNNGYYIGKVTLISSLGGLLFGFDMAVISGVLPFVQSQFALNAAEEGWFVSSALVGAVLGVAFSGELCDRFGRKKLLLLAALLFLISAVGSTLMPTFALLIYARMLGGIAVGIASNAVPLYLSEIAPSKIRGRLVTCYQLAITFGILVAYLTNAGLLSLSNNIAPQDLPADFRFLYVDEVWRGMFSIEVFPALLFFIGLIFIPESPRWLIQMGRNKDALHIMKKIKKEDEIKQDLEEIHANQYTKKGSSYKMLLAPEMRKPLLIGILLPLFSQFSGINAIIYYGPSILKEAGLNLNNAFLGQILLGTVNMLFTFIAVWKVDSLGRRPLYLTGTVCAAISLFVTGICFYTGNTESFLLLISATIFLASFAFSIGPLKFVIASEIFPDKIRGRALALSIMVMWVADTIVGQITPIMLAAFGAASTFWFFAFCCLTAFIVVYRMVPETKGKTLEKIQEMWYKKKTQQVNG
ncbi:sugar porter family MFS transporter [Anditalea andensis]|uniref:Major facilitator superfamily (MFS) profile domain-containing protein n=1 Tax=Anditalea andensis TaxID=1048983 RepID=A0A074KSH4_9BACT|nr:sugar porter family MFS transporter [Anditalea andensis]KEO71869.1 hypothetical protein EL17_20325 [Anditalea andensis]